MYHFASKKKAFPTPNVVTRNALKKPAIVVVICLASFLTACFPTPEPVETPTEAPTSIPLATTVNVLDTAGNPINGVRVQIRGTKQYGEKDEAVYRLPACGDGKVITAWAPGYYINWVECNSSNTDYTLSLERHEIGDWIYYPWNSVHADSESGLACRKCHEDSKDPKYDGHPIYTEWSGDKHSQSATNPYFLSIYNGGWYSSGTFIPQTGNVGPGYKLDNPQLNGNCAACHAPLAVVGEAVEVDLNNITSLAREGINCDFCHKILGVRLSVDSGLPFVDRPGLLSYEFLRPSTSEAQVLVGPLDDATNHIATYSGMHSESEFCAPCHYGKFWDTPIYNSYGEWKNSSYADKESGVYKTCQDCHMVDRRDSDDLETHPFYNHNMMVDKDGKSLLDGAVTLEVDTKYNEKKDRIIVDVTVKNDKVGHKVPTDSPLRHLIVLVQVSDSAKTPLPQLDGDTVPEWGGLGNPDLGYYSGLPGTSFGYILMDITKNTVPAISYWNPTQVILDTRIRPSKKGESHHEFASPEKGNAIVTVKVIYRYAFKELMDQKGWFGPEVEDVVIAKKEKTVTVR